MRITQENPGFAPVTIVLDTVQEAAIVAALVGNYLPRKVCEDANQLTEGRARLSTFDVITVTKPLYEKLTTIIEESKCLLR